mmetsp:Transcript_17238/g.39415  ORF Transcript_17238/g.39415 Transcript_17238/m.39415 type:complete len:207 (-) Transcript_17238:91-711(-)
MRGACRFTNASVVHSLTRSCVTSPCAMQHDGPPPAPFVHQLGIFPFQCLLGHLRRPPAEVRRVEIIELEHSGSGRGVKDPCLQLRVGSPAGLLLRLLFPPLVQTRVRTTAREPHRLVVQHRAQREQRETDDLHPVERFPAKREADRPHRQRTRGVQHHAVRSARHLGDGDAKRVERGYGERVAQQEDHQVRPVAHLHGSVDGVLDR